MKNNSIFVDDGMPTKQPDYTSYKTYTNEEECEPVITIGFNYINECGEHFSASSEQTVYESLGDRTIDLIAEQFNCFLRQIGYYRPNDNILVEDLTDAEYDYLCEKLDEYRKTYKSKEGD